MQVYLFYLAFDSFHQIFGCVFFSSVNYCHKFISADSCNQIFFPEAFFEYVGDRNNQFIALKMAEGVVYIFKPVYVHRENNGRLNFPLLNHMIEVCPVIETCKTIVVTEVLEFFLMAYQILVDSYVCQY